MSGSVTAEAGAGPDAVGAPEFLVEARGLVKRFGAFTANDHVDLAIRPGEIHALLGENGAGKSTLVKMLYGSLQPTAGRIFWKGEPVVVTDPARARDLGIGMVFQHFSLFEALTVLENIALGLDEAAPREELKARVETLLASYSLPLDPDREVHTLSVGERQRIEIVRCLLQNPKLLIMDEPTSVLTPQEAERLFETLRRIAADGCSILYISHKLGEVKALCERATILRHGKVVAECDPRAETARRMAELMIGAELRDVTRGARHADDGPVRLAVAHLSSTPSEPHGVPLRDLSFEVRAGEVLGVAGVAGNGQVELVAALSGETRSARADGILLDGRPIGHLDPGARRRLGLACVPEERNGHAAVPSFTLAENAVLTGRHRLPFVRHGMIAQGVAWAYASKVIERFDVRTRGPGALARSLSGGNLQKFIVGREIAQKPEALVVAQPTWGVDAGAAAEIHRAILALAEAGSAVVVISQDLDELIALSDRLVVLNEGRLSHALPVEGVKVEEIGLLMGGVHGARVEAGHAV
jgi:simple sugar transport system ATP-binding protein